MLTTLDFIWEWCTTVSKHIVNHIIQVGVWTVDVDWFCGQVAPMHLGLMLQALSAPLLVPSVNLRGARCHAGVRVLY
jgi:hypothetical protein